jgi:hypothetical protein
MEDVFERGQRHLTLIKKIKQELMEEGVHYATRNEKPRLEKPGAELLCKMFNFSSECTTTITRDDMTIISINQSGINIQGCFEAESVCVIKDEAGRVMGRHGGRSSNKESMHTVEQIDYVKNTVHKMSEIRSFIAATLIATGTSSLFTQDIDENHQENAAPQPIKSTKQAEWPTVNQENAIREKGMKFKLSLEELDACLSALKQVPADNKKSAVDEFFRVPEPQVMTVFKKYMPQKQISLAMEAGFD